jgi:hypothetical protein
MGRIKKITEVRRSFMVRALLLEKAALEILVYDISR